jgi:hypothetical protein
MLTQTLIFQKDFGLSTCLNTIGAIGRGLRDEAPYFRSLLDTHRSRNSPHRVGGFGDLVMGVQATLHVNWPREIPRVVRKGWMTISSGGRPEGKLWPTADLVERIQGALVAAKIGIVERLKKLASELKAEVDLPMEGEWPVGTFLTTRQ